MRPWRCGLMLWWAAWLAGCESDGGSGSAPPVASAPAVQTTPAPSDPNAFRVRFETTKGDFLVEVHPTWAPHGAERFRQLVEIGFYDDCAFFRVIDGFMAQFGINGDPQVHAQWADKNIPDDPVRQSNTRGMVTFAMTGMPNSRSTQLFINYGDNSFLDQQRFAPFGKVVEGMDVVESLYKGYGEGAPNGTGPNQMLLREQGNAYLKEKFPRLDYIKRAYLLQSEPAEPHSLPHTDADAPGDTPENTRENAPD